MYIHFKSVCFFFCVDIPHDAFVNDKSKVQTHTFTDFPPTAESDEEDVYDKTQVQGKCAYLNHYIHCHYINHYILVYQSKTKSFSTFMFHIC